MTLAILSPVTWLCCDEFVPPVIWSPALWLRLCCRGQDTILERLTKPMAGCRVADRRVCKFLPEYSSRARMAGHGFSLHMERNPKSRMISLRLSAEEYESLRNLYASYGARSVSDFARLAMKRLIAGAFASDDAVLLRLNDMDERLRSVEARLSVVA